MTVKLYHPSHGGVWEGPEASAEVLAESGWLPVPDVEPRAGYQPEPVVFAPVTTDESEPAPEPAKAKRATKSSKSDQADEDTDT